MKREEIQSKLVDYLDGNLSKEEMSFIEAYSQKDESIAQEIEELKQLFSEVDNDVFEEPSASLHSNFEQLLAYEKSKQESKVISLQERTSWKTYLQVAATVLIVLSAFVLGKFSSNTVDTNQQILAQIQSESASQRIAALNTAEQTSVNDTKILQAFINRLFYDKKPSVRLAAVEALTKFTSEEMVKEALIKALETDRDPAVQIELIQVLAKIEEKRALTPMRHLLNSEEVPQYVKKEIEFNITSIENS